MTVKYSKLSTEEPGSTVIDLSSPFSFSNKDYPKYFSYSKDTASKYKSAFTYSNFKPNDTTSMPGRALKQFYVVGYVKVIL